MAMLECASRFAGGSDKFAARLFFFFFCPRSAYLFYKHDFRLVLTLTLGFIRFAKKNHLGICGTTERVGLRAQNLTRLVRRLSSFKDSRFTV